MNRQAAGMVAALCVAGVLQAAPLNEKEARMIKSRLTPAPQSITLTGGADVVPEQSRDSQFAERRKTGHVIFC